MDSPALNVTLSSSNNSFEDCLGMQKGIFIWAFFSFLAFVLGFPLCIWVLWDLVDKHYRGRQPFTPNALFTANVTVMDSLFLASLVPDVLNYFLWDNKMLLYFSYLAFSLNFCGRPLLMGCVCLDCYMAVIHPLLYRSPTLSIRAVITAVIWLAALVNGVLFNMDSGLLAESGMWWPFLFCLAVIIYCDCCILWTLRQPMTARGEPHQQKKRARHIICVSLLVTLASYLPTMLAFTLGRHVFPDDKMYYCLLIIPALIPLQFTSVVMPAVYLRNVGKLCGITAAFCKNN